MKCLVTMVCVLALAGVARADDKPNPNGTWTYTAQVNGQSIDVTIKLKLTNGKLTGTVSAMDNKMKIEKAHYKDGKASFEINSEINGNKFSIKYKGTFKGDTFKGKRDVTQGGETRTRPFEAKRSKK
jgi:uncharacterized lipoprotein YehR (DUF1307 family)